MNIEELWKIVDKEKKSKALQALDANFYQRVSEYICGLEKERALGSTPKTRIMDDELKSARRAVEDIFDWRMRKMLDEALSRAKGSRYELKGLTEYETEIFDGVQKSIEAGRRKILGMIVGVDPNQQADRRPEKIDIAQKTPEPTKKETLPEATPQKNGISSQEFLMVRTMREIPAFAGTDGRTYGVASGEVIMLPRANVEALCKRGAVAIVNVKIAEGTIGKAINNRK